MSSCCFVIPFYLFLPITLTLTKSYVTRYVRNVFGSYISGRAKGDKSWLVSDSRCFFYKKQTYQKPSVSIATYMSAQFWVRISVRAPILRNTPTGGDITGGFCPGAGFPSCHRSIYRVSEDNFRGSAFVSGWMLVSVKKDGGLVFHNLNCSIRTINLNKYMSAHIYILLILISISIPVSHQSFIRG
jgi:hypothetical protein